MKILANNIRKGDTVLHQEQCCTVVSTQHIKPGKGPAYVQAELKTIPNNQKINHKFRSSDNIEKITLESKSCTFMYKNHPNFVFMDDTYESIEIDTSIIKEAENFLVESMPCTLFFYEDEIINIEIPEKIILEVKDTPSNIRGQTAAAGYKSVTLSTGLTIKGPIHLKIGDKIVVNTKSLTYVEKAN